MDIEELEAFVRYLRITADAYRNRAHALPRGENEKEYSRLCGYYNAYNEIAAKVQQRLNCLRGLKYEVELGLHGEASTNTKDPKQEEVIESVRGIWWK